ncbi:glycosyltransferase [Pseudotenacibaculum sp. MALMAid0570]|uniref:glycosyltransferase n=1 Tax=Pseudotenacibaculum sp. MALMAid0570 TaxID=3143938 RepID=UPI0032DED099
MKQILFIVNAEEISPNANGGAAVLYSHLELLSALDYKVILLAVEWNSSYSFKEEDYNEVKPFITEIVHYKVDEGKRKRRLNWLYHAIFKPTEFEYFFVNKKNTTYLQDLVARKSIDIVWCEWRWSAILAMKTQLSVPKIYSHHDWEYKLSLLRGKPSLNKKFHSFQKKRVEFQMVRTFDACISGSKTESDEIKSISQKPALYLPTTYKAIETTLEPHEKTSIVHLGGMGTTANRLGLERFLDVCWNSIKSEIPTAKLKVIGSVTKAHDSLKRKLEDNRIQSLGFVEDLNTVLFPEDIHIVPWEYNTGTRTRIPVALNHEQVLVVTRESVRCYPEITEENAILCDDLDEMKEQIIHLYSNREKLHLLGTKGKQTFIDNYTVPSQLNKLGDFLKTIHS